MWEQVVKRLSLLWLCQNVHKSWAKSFEKLICCFFFFSFFSLVFYNFPTHEQQFVANFLSGFFFCTLVQLILLCQSKAEGGSSSQQSSWCWLPTPCSQKGGWKTQTIKLISVQLCLFASLYDFTSFKGNLKVSHSSVFQSEFVARMSSCCAHCSEKGSRIHPESTKCFFVFFLGEQSLVRDTNWGCGQIIWSLKWKSFLILLENYSVDNLSFIETPAPGAAWKLPVASAVERKTQNWLKPDLVAILVTHDKIDSIKLLF